MSLTMNCDRCGNEIKHGEGGRDRWRFGGKDLIVDLCPTCAHVVRDHWIKVIEGWTNDPLEVTARD